MRVIAYSLLLLAAASRAAPGQDGSLAYPANPFWQTPGDGATPLRDFAADVPAFGGPGVFAAPLLPTPLEERVAAIEMELKRQTFAAAGPRAADIERPTFQIGGQLQIDYLWFGQDQVNRDTVGDIPDAIGIRRARFVARGEAFEQLEYIIGFDFALSGRPSFLDVWVGVKDLPYVGRARVGHFFEPFSLERNTQNHRNTFMERSLADAFAPARNVGMDIYDALGEEERASYRLGWYAANSDDLGDQFTDTGGQALTGRLTCLPVWHDEGRTFLHLGAAYSYRTPPNHVLAFATTPEARTGGPAVMNIPNFVSTGIIAADHHQLAGVECAVVCGPLYVQTEYMAAAVAQIAASDLFFDGGYVNVSYFLTGENRTYNKLFGIIDRVFPSENFFRGWSEEGPLATGKGAWEIAARYSAINLTDENIQGGRLHNYTIGLNWYLNAYTRVKWELIQANLNRTPGGESQAYIAGMRFDIDF